MSSKRSWGLNRRLTSVLLAALVAAVVTAVPASGQTQGDLGEGDPGPRGTPDLFAGVSDNNNFEIWLRFPRWAAGRALPAGTYRVRSARSAKRRGGVIRQSPRAGIRVRRGSRVSLVVSRGRR